MKYFILTFLFFASNLQAQKSSEKILTFDQYLEIVKTHHPLAKQAELQLKKGEANLQESRGAFDPKTFSDVSQKYFDNKKYYNIFNGGLKVPTWFGLEVQSGYEQNNGVLLNPENNTPGSGLWYAGISMPVGRGLFIDKRRAELFQAKIYKKSTIEARKIMYNELLYDAGKVYWDWFMAYNSVAIYQEAVTLANQRLKAVKSGVLFGDKSSIDTIEASIQVQNRMLNLQEAELNYKNTKSQLSVYLWSEGIIPLEIGDNTVPSISKNVPISKVDNILRKRIDSIPINHPVLKKSLFGIDQLKIQKKWKKEQLKPTLNLKYNAITEPVNNGIINTYSINNYKWGLEFNMPIFLRKERGSLQMTKLKLEEAELKFANKKATLTNYAIVALNSWETTEKQIVLYEQTVFNYSRLLQGERRKFNAGESSLFMVNSRESGYIKARIQYVKLLAKNHKASLATSYAFGLLSD